MFEMTRDPAVWRKELSPPEVRELELAERTKSAAVEQYNAVFQRLKNRCIQRVRAKADIMLAEVDRNKLNYWCGPRDGSRKPE